jgi:Domain of unknown function DUF11/Right handed beta helix region
MQSRHWATGRLSIAAGAAAVLVYVCLSIAPSAFATCTSTHYTVTTHADETTPDDGLLSLREAITEGGTVPCAIIELPAGHYPITDADGGTILITAHNSLRVQPQLPVSTARDVVIEGDGSHPLFHVASTENDAEFERLTLTDGGAGALVNEGGVNLTGITVAGNTGSEFGGGLYNSAGAQIQMQDSTISNNLASAAHSPAGGGIYNEGRLVITDSTISGNAAGGDEAAGGGIYNAGEVQLYNTTVDRNTASGNEAIAGDVDTTGAAITDTSESLFGGGSPENCNSSLTPVLGDHSISSDSSCLGTAEDVRLGPLQNNGGGTDTEMLLPGSPAIDVSSGPCVNSSFDQRGVSKPQGSKCDDGAYELVQSADLGVSGSAAPDPVSDGSVVAFTFDVASTAPRSDPSLAEDAVQPTLTDVLPAGLQFVSGSPDCSANGQTVTCSLGALADNAGPTAVTITARALALGSISNTAIVSSPRPDSNPGDDSATVTVTSNPPIALAPPSLTALILQPLATLALLGTPRVTGDRTSVRIACSGSPCSGTATATSVERLLGAKVLGVRASRHSNKPHKKPVTVGSTRFSIPPRQTRTVIISLNAVGRRLLARFRTLPATITIRLLSAGNTVTVARAQVSFKPKKKHLDRPR